jgi:hypothetical protein
LLLRNEACRWKLVEPPPEARAVDSTSCPRDRDVGFARQGFERESASRGAAPRLGWRFPCGEDSSDNRIGSAAGGRSADTLAPAMAPSRDVHAPFLYAYYAIGVGRWRYSSFPSARQMTRSPWLTRGPCCSSSIPTATIDPTQTGGGLRADTGRRRLAVRLSRSENVDEAARAPSIRITAALERFSLPCGDVVAAVSYESCDSRCR